MEEAKYSIGVDIGGTKISFGIVSHDGKILEKATYSTPQETRESIIDLMKEKITIFLERAKLLKIQIVGIGIGTAGQIDFEKGRVLSGTTNIKDWNDVPLRDIFTKKFDLPVWVDNDVNALTLAEQQLGVGKNVKDLICLALGTGVGGGVISGGNMIRGAWGGAAELGHITVDMNGPVCNCGLNGCLEVYSSGTGIANRMREKLKEYHPVQDSKLSYYQGHLDQVTSKVVFDLMNEGNHLAIEVVEKALEAFAYAIVSIIHTFNPSLIILAGGVLNDGNWFIKRVKDKVGGLGMQSLVSPVEFKMAELGPDAGLIGAALQPWVYDEV
ncbi:glucokinase [Bacillus niacini]|uniref:Glucokinase n=1 Tax=Neobacillus niacini TaxID=86668 RepID=A0A852TPM0_9BACI|nr:ROK family protein [Neobacillus niacini]NYE09008.1 glucokinase [Neobacillus niacini]